MRYYLTPVRMANIKSTRKSRCWENVDQGESSQTVVATIENSMKVPQKIKYRTTLQSNNHTTGIYPKNKKTGT